MKLLLCWISSVEVVEDVAAHDHILSNVDFDTLRTIDQTIE
jgi:hypothetical protein